VRRHWVRSGATGPGERQVQPGHRGHKCPQSTHRSRRRFFQRTTDLPWNLTFARAGERVRGSLMASAVVRACRSTIATISGPNGCIRKSPTGTDDPQRLAIALNAPPQRRHPGLTREPSRRHIGASPACPLMLAGRHQEMRAFVAANRRKARDTAPTRAFAPSGDPPWPIDATRTGVPGEIVGKLCTGTASAAS
jgi:hypothetical protein